MAMAAQQHDHIHISSSHDLDPLMKACDNARIVLLGEASHGTHEYYTWRMAISKRLIEENGFSFIAVEGDWPDCYRVNRYIKGLDNQDKTADQVLHDFNRWPSWMWANWEITALITWMKQYNSRHHSKAGFYGLDVYSLWESMEALADYLDKTDPVAAKHAKNALACFAAYNQDERQYAMHSLSASCKREVVNLLKEIRTKAPTYNNDPEAALNTIQNAHIAVEAEKYYSNMVQLDDQTWNIRDRHMMDTLNRVLDFHGKEAKAIVWEHNTHVGDARYTDMADDGLFNLGQLAREQYASRAFIVGFGSYKGSVIAGEGWGAPMRVMNVPDAITGSLEDKLHKQDANNRLIIFKNGDVFDKVLPHRAIGVVYHPQREKYNYVPTHVSKRYDAFIYIDESRALHPLHLKVDPHQVPATFPFEF
jgi:erythromycin esterase